MKKNLSAGLLCSLFVAVAALNTAQAQIEPPIPHNVPVMDIYRATPARVNDLINTKLDVRFDYQKCFMYGKEWVTLKPHFYPTDTLRLDAKGMDIHNISIVQNGKNIPLKYVYQDSLSLAIRLDRVYHNNENYTVYISYTSKPNLLKVHGSAAINDAKGLYFINPDGKDPDKPIQIWTQGETESSSAWFPTIDQPQQKTTDEITMTVPAKYVTLSNGKLTTQKINGDGTRTDTWKMDLPHSPYLFMMAVGDFKIYHDKWRGKDVDYYLEPKYAPYAKQIFGMTPELMEFYSKTLGVDYPWNKYAQIVVRDYVSGAMENTTATLHGEQVQLTDRQLLDAYYNDSRVDIAHELFHQWFGDYVTCENWTNITMNESFADFSEMLWAEHKYGKDEAGYQNYVDMNEYLQDPANQSKDLVRFHYNDKEDVFDLVSYQKGGRILNMLRTYLGDAAFFKGLKIYLTTNAFKAGEAQQLRLALEEASGLDLNWYFNQWYYGAGNPNLSISYKWDNASKTETIYLQQTQDGKPFILPFAIDIYAGGKKVRHNVWMQDKADTLTFNSEFKPDLVNVDGDKVLLVKKTDDKPLDQFVFQYFNAPLYVDRTEAITAATKHQDDKGGQKILISALHDKYYRLQLKAIKALDMKNDAIRNAAMPILASLAQTDPNTLVRAAAIAALGDLKASGNMDIFTAALSSRSYAIQGAALTAISKLDSAKALTLAKSFEADNMDDLTTAMVGVYATSGNAAEWPFVFKQFHEAHIQMKFNLVREFAAMTARVDNSADAQQGILELKATAIQYKMYGADQFIIGLFNNIIKPGRIALHDDASVKLIDTTIQEIQAAK
ncbi:M1 family aminopeptidase [Mucilaginibacter sp. E4BP6]|uniref:M1 family metallopeptidase n=1 Tax=Mucilaginibacter sp. E4BP6 TaxID=2723089 RepID=UPI0015C753B7|nr:M1 family metallopeptidase [Mucilaginibacter sp. E4BP6]NYE64528.1 aminopeptidase N [Mucilaginibacter sp. E4BP6]